MNKHSAQFMYDTLKMVANIFFKSEVIDTGMDHLTEVKKEDWIDEKVEEWIELAEEKFKDMIPLLSKKDLELVSEIAKIYYKMPLGSSAYINDEIKIIRVPGGWIHIYRSGIGVSSSFVSFNNEFQVEGSL